MIFVSCREVGDTEALVVTAIGSLKDADGDPLYSKKHPAKIILACDKVLCPKIDKHHGVKKIKVIYTLNNTGPLTKVAPPCPKKGVIGKDQEACVDYKRASGRMATSSCPSSSTSTPRAPASPADERRQPRPDDAQQLKGFVRALLSTQSAFRQLCLTHPS